MKLIDWNKLLLVLIVATACLSNELKEKNTNSNLNAIKGRSEHRRHSRKNEILKEINNEFDKENSELASNIELSRKYYFNLDLEKSMKKIKNTPKKTIKAKPKYTISKNTNPQLKNLNKKIIKRSIYYKSCVLKTGFLNIVQTRPTSPLNIIKVMPVFLKLTSTTLSIYQALDSKKPLSTFLLRNIMRIDQHYYNTNCLDIITTRIPNKNKQLKQGILTFCADNLTIKKDWVLKILEFKQCKLGNDEVDHNNIIIMDFDKINNSKKQAFKHYELSHLYYDGHDTANKPKNGMRKVNRLKKAFDMMKVGIQRGNLANQQIKRQYIGKLNKARNFSTSVSIRERILRRRLEKKSSKERERESSLLRLIHKKKELKMIKNVMNKIDNFKVK